MQSGVATLKAIYLTTKMAVCGIYYPGSMTEAYHNLFIRADDE